MLYHIVAVRVLAYVQQKVEDKFYETLSFFNGKILNEFLDYSATIGMCSPLDYVVVQNVDDEFQLVVVEDFDELLNDVVGVAVIHELLDLRTYLYLNAIFTSQVIIVQRFLHNTASICIKTQLQHILHNYLQQRFLMGL